LKILRTVCCFVFIGLMIAAPAAVRADTGRLADSVMWVGNIDGDSFMDVIVDS